MAENVYETLVNRILLGDYPPGSSLGEKEIAEELGVSRTPVREALLRLKLEGLVKIIPRGGIFVAEASVQKIREVTEVRLILEEQLGRFAVERRSEQVLLDYQNWLQDLKFSWDKLSPREWMQKDGEFHRFVDRAGGNETLSYHLNLLRQQSVLFWGQSLDGRSSLGEIIKDFDGVLLALRNRDADLCVRTLRQHVLDHVQWIQEYIRPEPLKLAI
jgi:DNA-binding GntR family transcriptional regulator